MRLALASLFLVSGASILIFSFLFLYRYTGSLYVIYSYIPLSVGIGGFSLAFRETIINYEKKRKKRIYEKRVKNQIIKYFQNVFKNIDMVKKVKINQLETEERIVRHLLSNVLDYSWENRLNIVVLSYFCRKFDQSKEIDIEVAKVIEEYSSLLKIRKKGEEAVAFFELYSRMDESLNFDNLDDFVRHFVDTYLPEEELSFLEELQKKGKVISTLRRVIKEGKLSALGVTETTISQIKTELKQKSEHKAAYVIIGHNIRGTIGEYIESFEGYTGKLVNSGPFAVRIVKITTEYGLSFFEELKNRYDIDEDGFFWVMPLDIGKAEGLMYPEDGEFTKDRVRRGYEITKKFLEDKNVMERELVLGAIKKTKIKVSQLLSVIPFNVLSPSLMPAENDFLISNYDLVKERLEVESVTDFKDFKPNHIAEAILDIGIPRYDDIELKTLDLESPVVAESIKPRFEVISKEIVENAAEYHRAIDGL